MMDFRRRPPAKDPATLAHPRSFPALPCSTNRRLKTRHVAGMNTRGCLQPTVAGRRRCSVRRLSIDVVSALWGARMSELLVRLEWFKAIILPHEGAVRARLKRICPAGFDVENLVAESLTRAYQVNDFSRVTAGRSYLFAIARNLLIDALRRETIVSLDFVADLDVLRSDDVGAERQIQARDELRWLQGLLERLSPQPRRVFVLRRVHDLSLATIADQMGLSVSTVEKHLAKALTFVAKARAEREDDEFGRTASRDQGPASDRRPGGRLRR